MSLSAIRPIQNPVYPVQLRRDVPQPTEQTQSIKAHTPTDTVSISPAAQRSVTPADGDSDGR